MYHLPEYRPSFYRLVNTSEKEQFEAVLSAETPCLVDEIDNQLRELIRGQYPALPLKHNEYGTLIENHTSGIDLREYGVWVYYPWNKKMVHILDESEFIELRTSRNNYKITDGEELLLSTKKVGVVGLSVGQSVSLTLAIERTVGELRIADFDILELSNLNRIRSGIHNLGLPKVVMVAREIAEIDPFLKVVIFPEGLSRDNMDRFFTEGGKLDLVVDECDGLDIKILMRHKARQLRIPLLMEASDRGTLDVERYDLEPQRPLLHGFIEGIDLERITDLTTEEKVPVMLAMLGINTITKRLKAAMLEVGQSITTWPQLASAVALGGAITADVCRRILLNQYHDSGRYFVDIEDLVNNQPRRREGIYEYSEAEIPELTLTDMQFVVDQTEFTPEVVVDEWVLRQLVEAALLAPSAGNNQPWKWLAHKGALYLFHNRKQSASWFDEQNFISQIGFGAALENIKIKAAGLGYETAYKLYPAGSDSCLVAIVCLRPGHAQAIDLALIPYLDVRCTNRRKSNGIPIDNSILTALKDAAIVIPGGDVSFITGQEDICTIAAIVGQAERIRFMHPQTHHEFFAGELKWNHTGTEIIYEGLDIKTLELSPTDEVGLLAASDPSVITLLNLWDAGSAFEKLSRTAIETSAATGLITMPEIKPANFVDTGRMLERIWLASTGYTVSLHPISAPLFLETKIRLCPENGLNDQKKKIIGQLHDRLKGIFPALNKHHGVFMFRLSYATPPTARSLRLPIQKLYSVY